MTGRPKALLELTSDETEQLERWVRRRQSAQALALRSRIVLSCATGLTNKEVAAQLGVSMPTVGKWRSRFVESRLDGLVDEPRSGRKPTADGTVISSLHRRHRSIEFKKFLAKPDAEVPADMDVHLICDNYGTHKTPAVKTWLAAHPRFQMHFTPTYSSWLNQVERFLASSPKTAATQPSQHRPAAGSRHPRLGEGLEHSPETLHLDQDCRRNPRIPRTTIKTNLRRTTLGGR